MATPRRARMQLMSPFVPLAEADLDEARRIFASLSAHSSACPIPRLSGRIESTSSRAGIGHKPPPAHWTSGPPALSPSSPRARSPHRSALHRPTYPPPGRFGGVLGASNTLPSLKLTLLERAFILCVGGRRRVCEGRPQLPGRSGPLCQNRSCARCGYPAGTWSSRWRSRLQGFSRSPKFAMNYSFVSTSVSRLSSWRSSASRFEIKSGSVVSWNSRLSPCGSRSGHTSRAPRLGPRS